jgi:AAA+ ATPase superfamily predicted ATPase
MARPSEYNFDMCKEICDELAHGQNIKRILDSDESFPDWTTFRRWKQNNEELRTLYINSQRDKAIALENELDDLRDMLTSKEIDASTYNVLAQTLKWKMAKFYPKVFGDKIDHTTDGEKIQSTVIVNLGSGLKPDEITD